MFVHEPLLLTLFDLQNIDYRLKKCCHCDYGALTDQFFRREKVYFYVQLNVSTINNVLFFPSDDLQLQVPMRK
uniref:Uncharacterized protein n=1 Tax=Anguilla anguilla TaxID=7936 RepID=A0A0E9XSN1_ANGAN